MTDKSGSDRKLYQGLLNRIRAARQRKNEQPSSEELAESLARSRRRFDDLLNNDTGDLWSADSEPNDIAVPFAKPSPAPVQTSSRQHDMRDHGQGFKLAAAAGDDERGGSWMSSGFELSLPGAIVAVFARSAQMFVPSDALEADWQGVTIGKYRFYFTACEADAAWTQIEGLSLHALRTAARGAKNGEQAKIEAEPF